MGTDMDRLLAEVRMCRVCEQHLQLGANPVIAANASSKIVIIGQAPGKIVHHTGIPWNDKSGDNLRKWMNVDKSAFYNTDIFALMPMGFCYPGKGRAGDLPPRPECAPLWHNKIMSEMKQVRLVLLIGQYAQNYYLQNKVRATLTDTVRAYKDYMPKYIPLPHPSPRNNIWQSKNKWFDAEVLPLLQETVANIVKKG